MANSRYSTPILLNSGTAGVGHRLHQSLESLVVGEIVECRFLLNLLDVFEAVLVGLIQHGNGSILVARAGEHLGHIKILQRIVAAGRLDNRSETRSMFE